MQARIGNALLQQLKPAARAYEVYDEILSGLVLRVQPTGVMTYICVYRAKESRKRRRVVLGRHPVLTPVQARDKAKTILGLVADGKDPAGDLLAKRSQASQHTVGSFVEDEYAPWARQHLADPEGALSRLKACFEADIYPKRLAELTQGHVEKWRTAKLKNGASPATVNRDVTALQSVLSRALDWRLVDAHPIRGLKRAKVEEDAVTRWLSDDEETRLREAMERREAEGREARASANRWRAERGYPLLPELKAHQFVDHLMPMVLISMNTGLRQGELFLLRWADVDLARRQLTVVARNAKSRKARRVELNAEAAETLTRWKDNSVSQDALVFPNDAGKPFDNVQTAWQSLLKDARITRFRWHDLRHHFASRLAMAGVDLNSIRQLLGHSDMKTTLRYAHLSQQHLADAVARLCTKPKEQKTDAQESQSGTRVRPAVGGSGT